MRPEVRRTRRSRTVSEHSPVLYCLSSDARRNLSISEPAPLTEEQYPSGPSRTGHSTASKSAFGYSSGFQTTLPDQVYANNLRNQRCNRDLSGSLLLGPGCHLEVTSVLGAGSFGQVYRAKEILPSTSIGQPREFAVKTLLKAAPGDSYAEVKKYEAAVHAHVSGHPGVVTLHETYENETHSLLHHGFARRNPLRSHLSRGGARRLREDGEEHHAPAYRRSKPLPRERRLPPRPQMSERSDLPRRAPGQSPFRRFWVGDVGDRE